MNGWEIRHIVQYRRKEGYSGWYDDTNFYSGWFHHDPSWSDEPSESLLAQLEERKKEMSPFEFRIVVEKRAFIRRII